MTCTNGYEDCSANPTVEVTLIVNGKLGNTRKMCLWHATVEKSMWRHADAISVQMVHEIDKPCDCCAHTYI